MDNHAVYALSGTIFRRFRLNSDGYTHVFGVTQHNWANDNSVTVRRQDVGEIEMAACDRK